MTAQQFVIGFTVGLLSFGAGVAISHFYFLRHSRRLLAFWQRQSNDDLQRLDAIFHLVRHWPPGGIYEVLSELRKHGWRPALPDVRTPVDGGTDGH